MGLFGNRRNMSASQQVAGGGDGVNPSTMQHGDPRNRVFGDGSFGDILGGLGKIAAYGPMTGIAQGNTNRRRELEDSNIAYKSAMAERAGTLQPTGTMQNVAAAGFMPGTPEYQAYMQKLLMQPRFITLGNAESGQEVIDANNPPAAPGPPAQAVQDLRNNPGSAAQFDEIFGQGAAARALGGQ